MAEGIEIGPAASTTAVPLLGRRDKTEPLSLPLNEQLSRDITQCKKVWIVNLKLTGKCPDSYLTDKV